MVKIDSWVVLERLSVMIERGIYEFKKTSDGRKKYFGSAGTLRSPLYDAYAPEENGEGGDERGA